MKLLVLLLLVLVVVLVVVVLVLVLLMLMMLWQMLMVVRIVMGRQGAAASRRRARIGDVEASVDFLLDASRGRVGIWVGGVGGRCVIVCGGAVGHHRDLKELSVF